MLATMSAAALIFALRCVDVSLGTLRLILTVQGRRGIAAAIGFVEVSVFITAVASVVGGPLDPWRVLGYGLGFSAGTWLGMTLDRRIGIGTGVVRVISERYRELIASLTAAGFGVTLVEGRGGKGTQVGILFSVTRRRRLAELLALIHRTDSRAIASVQEVRMQYSGFFAPKRPGITAAGPVEGTL
jgi:uncharacterized protein YebE (UPF0316 family)